jgi:acylphosphatase
VNGDGDLVRARIVVRGKVQMVGFRAFVVRMARRVGGTVRNLPDGSVECIAEGPQIDVDELIERMGEGPTASRVDSADVSWEIPSGNYTDMRAT